MNPSNIAKTVINTITKADLDPVLSMHLGNCMFEKSLASVSTNEQLIRVLARYIHFNSPFGGGVANLAGEIATRPELFRDPDEEVEQFADRSSKIAADIFYAAIDEFGDSTSPKRATHRTLAQATLKGVATYLGFDAEHLNQILRPDESLLEIGARVRNGYCLNQSIDEPKLLHSIGYHAGSEVLADEEFNILDRYLQTNHPALVEYLTHTRVNMNGAELPAYIWVSVHCSVEADHFECAIRSANSALRYYAGQEKRETVKQQIIEGFQEFASVQSEFMQSLLIH